MGDIADMIIEGDLCEQCGEYLEDDEDYPHLCPACEKEQPNVEHLNDGKDLADYERRNK